MADRKAEGIPYRFMAPLVLGTMMNPLNSTMLATALLTICHSFRQSISDGAILITSLYITSTIAQPLMGRLADIYSPKKINFLAFVLVLMAALVGVFAPAFGWLIVSRVLLGLGTSAAYPSAMALVNKHYAEEGRLVPGRILGVLALSGQVSMVLGPVLGGLLTQMFGWKGIFLINIPWVIVAMVLSRAIPDYPPSGTRNKGSLFKELDVTGIVLFSLFLLFLMFSLTSHSFSMPHVAILLILFLLLIGWELRQQTPFVDVRMLKQNLPLTLVYVRTMATNFVLYVMLYAMPQWLEGVKRFAPAETGLLMIPNSIMSAVIGLLIAKSTNLFRQNLLGVGVMIAACAGLLLLHQQTPVYFIFLFTLLMGMAEGINLIANQALMNAESPLAQKGVSAGLYRTFGYIGAIISGSQIKTHFSTGVTDSSFHQLAFFTLISCTTLIILLVPLYIHRGQLK
jgi:MFS family permease